MQRNFSTPPPPQKKKKLTLVIIIIIIIIIIVIIMVMTVIIILIRDSRVLPLERRRLSSNELDGYLDAWHWFVLLGCENFQAFELKKSYLKEL